MKNWLKSKGSVKMADTVKTSEILSIGVEYDKNAAVKKTTTIKIPNYKPTITEQQIKNVFANQNVLVVPDGTNEWNPVAITSDDILTAATTNQTITNLDIGWED